MPVDFETAGEKYSDILPQPLPQFLQTLPNRPSFYYQDLSHFIDEKPETQTI